MPGENSSAFEKIAKVVLRTAVVFGIGFAVAESESVQKVLNDILSGALKDELSQYTNETLESHLTVWSTAPHALDGGAVLIGPEYSKQLALLLVNEEGHVLHRWQVENRIFNTEELAWWKALTLYEGFAIDDAHLLPSGDVIFIQLDMGVNNYRGQRLARMDRDSHILWQVPGNFHHHIDIAQDRIFAITSRLIDEVPEAGPKLTNIRYLDDWVETYTLDGKRTDGWSITDAFVHSPYRNWLASFDIDVPDVQRITTFDGQTLYDLTHINSVQYLDALKAKALPRAQAGDLLISFRALSALAVFRPSTRQIVWACKGPWRHQHNAQVGQDGMLYIYDNDGRQTVASSEGGRPIEQKLSSVIRYDPFTGQKEDIFASTDLHSFFLGDYAPLSGGKWIVDSPLHARVLVLSPKKKVLWELRTVSYEQPNEIPRRKEISMMHYYPASALSFLTAGKSALP
jgi:hypothetical protein